MSILKNKSAGIPLDNGETIYAQGWLLPTLILQSRKDNYHLKYFFKTSNAGIRSSGIYRYDKNSNTWAAQFTTASTGIGLTIKDEGTALAGLATALNFTGANVQVMGTGTEKIIDITGASSTVQSIVRFADGYVQKRFADNRLFIVNSAGLINIGGDFADRATLSYS